MTLSGLSGGLKIIGLVLLSRAVSSFAKSCIYNEKSVTVYSSFNRTIKSPNYPTNYDKERECTWLIKVQDSISYLGYIVKVTFSDFQLEESTHCSDELYFFDGMSSSSNFLGSYCRGTTHPEVIYSSGKYLYVKFKTFSYGYRGFSLRVSAVKKEEASGICRPWDNSYTVHNLSGTSGTIFSPDYPVPYPNNARCTWTITVPDGKIVKLKFEDIDLKMSYDICDENNTNTKDYVKIGDGLTPDPDSKELALYCGYNTFPNGYPELYSTERFMWVKFNSNTWKQWRSNKGFKARFEAVDHLVAAKSREVCSSGNPYNNDLKLNGSSGTLQSPKEYEDLDNYYPAGASCNWLITVPNGKVVKLSFNRFYLEPASSGSSCTADYVEVLDGRYSSSESKGRFCGIRTPDDIYSSDRYMLVRFRSDIDNVTYDGFKATYTAVDKPNSTALIVGIVVGVLVFFIAIVCCVLCVVKNKRKHTAGTGATIPMSTTTQPGVIQHPPPPPIQPPYQPPVNPYPPPVGYAPGPENTHPLPVAPNPYPPFSSEPPPPYPGNEPVPQYPPPGQSYPWVQNEPAKASAPPGSP